MDLLKLEYKNNIFDFTCNKLTYTLDGNNRLADGISYKPLLLMEQQNKTYMA